MRPSGARRDQGGASQTVASKKPVAAARSLWKQLRPPSGPAWLWRSGSLVGLAVVWEIAALFANSNMLPTPIAVLAAIYRYTRSGQLPLELAITLGRVAAAFVVAMTLGAAIGFMMGRFRRFNLLLDGALVLALNIPALVVIILCYLWLGLTEAAIIVAVALNKIPVVVVTTREGTRAVDARLLAVAQVYRVPRMVTLYRVYLPQLYPYLMASARNGLALIWKIVLVAELLGRSNGVGFELSLFFQFFDITSILAYTLAFAAVVMAIEAGVMRPLEKRLTRWRG
ncbi:MAG TPA: ABC transporter permease [Rhodanobacteraceae bacterium]|jgi:NitT/TauT family transport system permease protein|nr:ABC transporter permease [Rhodanobacteraceae bacterium]